MELQILSKKDIKKALSELDKWDYVEEENKITKEFEFEDFMDALLFVNRISDFFEKNDHHADIHIRYNRIRFDLQRSDVGGKVTTLDILTAKEIDRVYNDRLIDVEQ